ncbi:MAG: flagellar hook-associated protein FlgL [Thermoleophilia bacterium]|nr:flagellar hook-associated protein FlgL [Thermoleophilia bacterium]
MTQRVTDYHFRQPFLTNLNATNSKMSELSRQISSGQRIGSPDDDPFGTSQVLGFDSKIAETQQYQKNISDASGMLSTEEGAIDNVQSAMKRIRNLVVQAGNSPNQSGYSDIATEILQLKESIRQSANTRFGDTYVFSGTANVSPYPAPANVYAGTTNVMARSVAPGVTVNLTVGGPTIFGPSPTNVLDLCDQIVADLGANNTAAMGGNLASLDANLANISNQRGTIGITNARLESISQQLSQTEESLSAARSKIGDTDAAKAYTDLQTQNTMYQAALAAGSKIMKTSLLDFL